MRRFHIRILPGDRVKVELWQCDLTRGSPPTRQGSRLHLFFYRHFWHRKHADPAAETDLLDREARYPL